MIIAIIIYIKGVNVQPFYPDYFIPDRIAAHAQSDCARHLAHVPSQASSIVHATMKASPFFKVVRGNFDEFEMVYPERY
jgi:hypothetical protein